MLNTKALLRPLIPGLVALKVLVGGADARADNVKFPKATAEAVDAGAVETTDSLGGGKGGLEGVASPGTDGLSTSPALVAIPEVKDPSADPGGFIGDVASTGKKSWPLGVLLGMIGAALMARKYVASLRKPGTRTAAIVSAGIAAATALLFWRTGAVSLEEFMSALGIAIALVLSPHAPEQPPEA